MLMNHAINYAAPNTAAAVTVHCLADDAAHSAKIEPIAGLIYKADPHIYPGAFGEDTAFATKVIAHFLHHAVSYLLKGETSILPPLTVTRSAECSPRCLTALSTPAARSSTP